MPTKYTGKGPGERMLLLGEEVKAALPQLSALFNDEDQFRGLSIKARDDGSMLGIAKSYLSDGTPSVCFGVGYGLVATLMAVDATIAAGHWKVDKFA